MRLCVQCPVQTKNGVNLMNLLICVAHRRILCGSEHLGWKALCAFLSISQNISKLSLLRYGPHSQVDFCRSSPWGRLMQVAGLDNNSAFFQFFISSFSRHGRTKALWPVCATFLLDTHQMKKTFLNSCVGWPADDVDAEGGLCDMVRNACEISRRTFLKHIDIYLH